MLDLWTVSNVPHLLRTDEYVVHENGVFAVDTMQRVTHEKMGRMLLPVLQRLERVRLLVLASALRWWVAQEWEIVDDGDVTP